MKPKTRIAFVLTALALCLALVGFTPWGQDLTPAITSDKADYAPGETVTLTGVNFPPREAVHIYVNDDGGQTWSHNSDPDPVTGDSGSFTYQFQLPVWFVANYSVTATTTSGARATTTFTDLSIGTYDQCSNDTGTGYTSGDTGCRWINGNLNSNNSTYLEGDATVQRLWLTDLAPGSTHTVTFQYGTTKGGKHAYDFLTTWDWSEGWISLPDRCQGIAGCETASETQYPIPVDPNAGGFDAAIASRNFTMRGGTLTAATTPNIVSGSYAGDSETQVTLTYTVGPSSGAMCSTKQGTTTCGVAIWFGAHVSAQANWGLGLGAGSISGSPYHVALSATDGASVGQRDNQMQANVVTLIPNGTIIIVKDAVPNSAQDFNFNLNNNGTISQNFSLDDDSDPTLPNSRTFSVPPGAWTATEFGPLPSGWSLTGLTCSVVGTGGSTTTTDLAGGKAAITLKSNDTVTCTYTNTQSGTIIVEKKTIGGDGTFGFTTTGTGISPSFNLTTTGGSATQTFTNVPAGNFSVSETTPAGWTLTGSSCTSGAPSGFTLTAGGTVTCTFTNTRTYNKDLKVEKSANAAFDLTYAWDIYKNVDKTTASIAGGGSATFNYTVGVTHDSGTPGAWAVSGIITVTNPNAFDIAGVNLSDAIPDGTCTVVNGTGLTVPAGDKIMRNYSCTFSAAPAPGANTATATWDAAAYNTQTGSASGTASYDFAGVTPTVKNGTVTVTDTLGGDLGQAVYTDASPKEFTYAHTFNGVGGTCTNYDNTATITENGKFAKKTVEVCAGKDLTVTKTAAGTFDRAYQWKISKDVDQTRVNIAAGGAATFNYTVKVEQTGATDSGWALAGKITVTNPNDWEAVTVDVTDTVDNGGTCTVTGGTAASIPAGQSVVFDYVCAYGSAPASSSGTNTAVVTWDKAAAFTPSDTASGSAGFTLAQQGSTNKTVTVTDSLGGDLGTLTAADAAPYASGTFTYSKDFQGVGGKCTTYDNTATITETGQTAGQSVEVCVGLDLTVTKTAAGTFNRAYTWQISKAVDKTRVEIADGGSATFQYTVQVDQTGVSDSGWTLAGKITISNPNDWEDVTLTSLTDAVDNGGVCTVAPGPYVVPAASTLEVGYTCAYASAPSSYTGTNTAAAAWDKAAAFTPGDTASGSAGFTLAQLGSSNKTVTVTDSLGGNLGTVTALDVEPFASKAFNYTHTFPGVGGKCTTYDNTATITETGQTAGQTVTVCVGLDLTLTKTAVGSFDRAYLWKISKDVDQTRINIAAGGLATFNYTVNVEQTGITDSGWKLGGVITVANPNDWQDVTLTGLTDAVDNGGTCTVDPGPYVVPAGKTLDVGYTCAFASAPTSYTGTNTAAAAWDSAAAFTPTGSASGSAAFTLSQLGATNKTVTVTDSLGGNLGTLTAADTAPYAAQSFTYSHTFPGVGGTCKDYDNTATIVETNQVASQTVKVCVGLDLAVSKTAAGTFDRAYTWQISKAVDRTRINIPLGGAATFHYTVNVEQTGITDSGWTLAGKITISNPNDWEDITLTGLTDAVDNGGACTVAPGPYLVKAADQLEVGYTCAFASAPSSYSGTNTAAVAWDKAAAFTPGDTASGSVGFTLTQLGSTGKTVHVTDTFGGDLGTVTAADGAPFASGAFTYDRTESGVGGKCTTYDNTAAITETKQTASQSVEVCVGLDLTVTKTAAGTFDRAYLWKISKAVDQTRINIAAGGSAAFQYTVQVDQTGFLDSGWVLAGKITVSNPNDSPVSGVDVTDVVDNGGACAVTGGTGITVPANGSVELAYACAYASAPSSYTGTNTATAAWDKEAFFTPSGSASGSAGFTLAQLGSSNKTVTVTDSLGGNLGTVTAADVEPFASKAFNYTHTFPGVGGTCTTYDNTATITETGQTAGKTVTVCVGLDLTLTKTAAGTFDRAYLWKISKAADQTTVKIAEGGSYTFHYTVDVEQTGITDSGWTLAGKITISNPNDWQDITLTSLTDVVDNGGTCTVDPGPYVVPAGKKLDVGYTCAFASAPTSYTGTNTAAAAWDSAAAFTPSDTASGSAGFTLAQLGSTNKTVHVTDSFGGDLGTVTAADVSPFASAAFTYDRTESGAAGTCTSYDNTATITETTQSASQTVTLCVARDLTVTKTAVPSFTRTWTWTITKDFDDSYNLFAGDTVTHGYKVTVAPTFADSAWKLEGKITITNPNDWEAVSGVSVQDYPSGQNWACTVTPAFVNVPAGGTAESNYSCQWYSAPESYTGTNTVAVTWDKTAASTPSGSATATKDYEFTNPTEIDPVITVDDDNLTGENWSADRKPGEWTYTRDFACSTDASKYTDGKYSDSHTNTATINETGQTDTAKVDVTCYWPQIDLTKTGDTLSKIGDDVTYTIKLDNNTPVDAKLRALSCTISDTKIGFSKTVTLASGASDSSTKPFTIPSGASDPFDNTASVTCKPVTATAPVVGSTTFSVGDSSTWSTNLFQPAVEIVKSGPTYATSGDVITYTFTITNKSSSDSPNLVLDTLTDNVLGDLADDAPAACDNLGYNGSCSFTVNYTVPDVGLQPKKITNTVTLHMHPAGFPNDITDTGDHTVTVAPRSQLTNTSYCPLPNNQFRLLYHPDQAANIYRLQASNPGQFYFNGFYYGTPGSTFTMTLQVPYPFMTQENAGNPIQVHDGFGITTGGCYIPNPSLNGFTIATLAMTPTSSAGNQIITIEDYPANPVVNSLTTVTVTGTVPPSGMVYVTIHLDYGLKKTTGWKNTTSTTSVNLVDGKTYQDLTSNGVTILGYQTYKFARRVGSDTAATTPSSYNELKKFAGFVGMVTHKNTSDPLAGLTVQIYNPNKQLIATLTTDEDGYYLFAYKHTSKAATYTVKLPKYNLSTAVTVKANGFAAVDYEVIP